jgi:hypothetical protein
MQNRPGLELNLDALVREGAWRMPEAVSLKAAEITSISRPGKIHPDTAD